MAGRILAWAIADGPTTRRWLQIMYTPRIGIAPILGAGNPLRNTATGNAVKRTKPKTANEVFWRIPWWQYWVPEDWKRYELGIQWKNWIEMYRVMVDKPGTTDNMLVHIKWAGKDLNLPASKNNRFYVGSAFKQYSAKNNNYEPIEADALFYKLRDDDITDEEIEKAFDQLRYWF